MIKKRILWIVFFCLIGLSVLLFLSTLSRNIVSSLWWQRLFLYAPLRFLPRWIQDYVNSGPYAHLIRQAIEITHQYDKKILTKRALGLMLHIDAHDKIICAQALRMSLNRSLNCSGVDLSWYFYPTGFMLSAPVQSIALLEDFFSLLKLQRQTYAFDHLTLTIPVSFFFADPEAQIFLAKRVKSLIRFVCKSQDFSYLPFFICITQISSMTGFDCFYKHLPHLYTESILSLQSEDVICDATSASLWKKNIDQSFEKIESLYRQFLILNHAEEEKNLGSAQENIESSQFLTQYSLLCQSCKNFLDVLFQEEDPLEVGGFCGFFLTEVEKKTENTGYEKRIAFVGDFFRKYLLNPSYHPVYNESFVSSVDHFLKSNRPFVIAWSVLCFFSYGFFSFYRHEGNINIMKKQMGDLFIIKKNHQNNNILDAVTLDTMHQKLIQYNRPMRQSPISHTVATLVWNPYLHYAQEWTYVYFRCFFSKEQKKQLKHWAQQILLTPTQEEVSFESIMAWLSNSEQFQQKNKWWTLWCSNNKELIELSYKDQYSWSVKIVQKTEMILSDFKIKVTKDIISDSINQRMAQVFLKQYEHWQNIIWNKHPIKESIQNFYTLYHPFYKETEQNITTQTLYQMRESIKALNLALQNYKTWIKDLSAKQEKILGTVSVLFPSIEPQARNIYSLFVRYNNRSWLEKYTQQPLPLIAINQKGAAKHGGKVKIHPDSKNDAENDVENDVENNTHNSDKFSLQLSSASQSMIAILNWVFIFNLEERVKKLNTHNTNLFVPEIYEIFREIVEIFDTKNTVKTDRMLDQWKTQVRNSVVSYADQLIINWLEALSWKGQDAIQYKNDGRLDYHEDRILLLLKLYHYSQDNAFVQTAFFLEGIMDRHANALTQKCLDILEDILWTDMKTGSLMYPTMGFLLGGAFGWSRPDDVAVILRKKRQDLDKFCEKILSPVFILLKKLPQHKKSVPKWVIFDRILEDSKLYVEKQALSEWGQVEQWFNKMTLLSVIDKIPESKISRESWLREWTMGIMQSMTIASKKWSPVQMNRRKNAAIQPALRLWDSVLNGFFPFCDHQNRKAHKGFSLTEDVKKWWMNVQRIQEKIWPRKKEDLHSIAWFFDSWCGSDDILQWNFYWIPNVVGSVLLGWNITTSFQSDSATDFKNYTWLLLNKNYPVSLSWNPGQSLMLALQMIDFHRLDKTVEQPWVVYSNNVLKCEFNNNWSLLSLLSQYGTPDDNIRIPLCYYDNTGQRRNHFLIFRIEVMTKKKEKPSWYRLLNRLSDISFLKMKNYDEDSVHDEELATLLEKEA